MSASEKLKALNDAPALEKYEIDLFAALPEIIAVVEAAELLLLTNDEAAPDVRRVASTALAALEEKLS